MVQGFPYGCPAYTENPGEHFLGGKFILPVKIAFLEHKYEVISNLVVERNLVIIEPDLFNYLRSQLISLKNKICIFVSTIIQIYKLAIYVN